MLFLSSKLLWIVIEPANAILIMTVAGVVLLRPCRPQLGYGIVLVGVASLVVIALFPIPQLLLAPLEDRFAEPHALPERVDGIIVLGGAVDPREFAIRGTPGLNEAAERMTSFVKLVRAYPSARAVFTGGNGTLNASEATEADVAKKLFGDLGVDTSRVLFEGKSRNTYENVLFSKNLVHPRPDESWILITSADHMPRAVGIFRRLDWPVIPYPVAYKSDATYQPDLADHLNRVDEAAHEWIGLIAYRLLGRTNALFPGPEASALGPG